MSIGPSGAGAQALFRIVDANLNRIGEGLRVLEEVARLLLNDSGLTGQLKTLRHDILRSDFPFHQRLLQARDAEADVGAYAEVAGESPQREIPIMVLANARRVEESLRLLEEVAKLPGSILPLPSERYKQARFAVYAIEQKLLSRLNRLDKGKLVSGLYVVIDTESVTGQSPVHRARIAINAGARVIELYDSGTAKKDLFAVARELATLCRDSGTLFIVRDHLDVALASPADGLRIGQDSLPAHTVRGLLPLDRVLGVSVETVEQAVSAASDGADFIVAHLDIFEETRRAVAVPVVAAGDVPEPRISEILSAGGCVVVTKNALDLLRGLDRAVKAANG